MNLVSFSRAFGEMFACAGRVGKTERHLLHQHTIVSRQSFIPSPSSCKHRPASCLLEFRVYHQEDEHGQDGNDATCDDLVCDHPGPVRKLSQ